MLPKEHLHTRYYDILGVEPISEYEVRVKLEMVFNLEVGICLTDWETLLKNLGDQNVLFKVVPTVESRKVQ